MANRNHHTLSRQGLAALVLATLALPASAQIFVDGAAPQGGNGQGWATAYSNLQTALGTASSGQSVWVAAGTYAGGFSIPAGVTLRGGFAAGDRRADQARPYDNVTILDGQSTQRVVSFGSGSTLDGFAVRNGNAPAPGGGGGLVDGVTATIRRCEFSFNDNSGGRGAALTVINGGDPLVVDCEFHHNANSGHTIDVHAGGRGTFDHLTIADNAHNGLHMQEGAVCTIQNCLFVRNMGRGLCDVLQGFPNQITLRNNLFWQNSVSLVHVMGSELHSAAAVNALSNSTANIAADPAFQSATDYRLQANSGAIDIAQSGLETRLDRGGMPRTTDGDLDGTMRRDIGAHEFNNCVLTSTGTATAGNSVTLQVSSTPAFGGVAMLFPGPSVTVAPFGTVYGTSPIVVILGFLPGTLNVNFPSGFAADLVFQGFCFSPISTGNLSNPLAFSVQ